MRGTFSLLTHDLLRFRSGKPIPTAKLNAALEALERSRVLAGTGTGLSLSQMPNGVAVRATPRRTFAIAKVTAQASAASGTGTYTSDGRATILLDAGSSPLTDGPETGVKFKNYHDVAVKVGYVVELTWQLGAWWVTDAGSCSALGTPGGDPPPPPPPRGGLASSPSVAQQALPPELTDTGRAITAAGGAGAF